jgi:hypothetical protein
MQFSRLQKTFTRLAVSKQRMTDGFDIEYDTRNIKFFGNNNLAS